AFLYACAVLPIQIAHFGTADAMTNLWVAMTFLFLVRAQDNGTLWDYALCGAAFGAALASRVNIAPLVIAIIFAAAVRMLPALDNALPRSERWRAFAYNFGGLVLAGFTTLLIFRIFNPYAFLGPGFFGLTPNPRWFEDLGRARYMTSAASEAPPQWQWVGRAPYIFPMTNMLLWGMGLALGVTAWVAWGWSGWQLLRGKADGLKNAPIFLFILVYFGWVGANFVMSMRYYLPMYSILAVLAAWLLITLIQRANQPQFRLAGVRRALAVGLTLVVTGFTFIWGAMFTNVYRHQSTFVQVSHWIWENVPGDFAMQLDGTQTADVPLINIAFGQPDGMDNDALSKALLLMPGQRQTYDFTAPADGTVSSVHAPSLGLPFDSGAQTSALRIWVTQPGNETVLTETVLTSQFNYRGQQVGDAYDIPLNPPLTVAFGQKYTFNVQVTTDQPIVSGGSIFARDGGWEEVVPSDICLFPTGVTFADDPPPGAFDSDNCDRRRLIGSLVIMYDFNLHNEEDPNKRDETLKIVDNTDYIVIATNRRYDSQARIPLRWPMTMRYYDTLFSGELGFDLIQTFQESFELGPLKVSDQYLPSYKALGIPEWLNEFESEEAFTVYDHPAVFLFKKRADYSPENARAILYSVPLTRVDDYGRTYSDPTLIGPVPWNVERA
ncbi:MAG: glycosyltransferase family 39 protein, partial [Armatimonadetes bacterium]|nr:glycosyltransferase family 39 protein [Anaerolineae bacterium]